MAKQGGLGEIESRHIDYIPLSERRGKFGVRDHSGSWATFNHLLSQSD